MKLNTMRIFLGGAAGGVGWLVWSLLIGMKEAPFYAAMQQQGLFLKQPRYSLFAAIWVLMIFVISILLAHLYAWSRGTLGAGPKTAVKIGMIVGFCAGFPGNFAQATWSPIPRVMPLGWLLDIWIGCIIATLIAGALYKDRA